MIAHFIPLFQEDKDDIEHYLPIELGRIKITANKSLKLAKEVEDKFKKVMLLTGELLEASVAAKSSIEEKQKEAGMPCLKLRNF